MVAAYELSERFDTPVLFRTTTRTSHSKSLVTLGERTETEPGHQAQARLEQVRHDARQRHRPARRRRAAGARPRAEYAEDCPFNRIEMGDPEVGIITSGSAYGYTREALPERQLPQAGHDLSAAQEDDRRVPLQGGQALRGRGARSVHRGGHQADGHQDRRRQGAQHPAGRAQTPASVAASLAKAGVPGVNPDLLAEVAPDRRRPAQPPADALPGLLAPRRLHRPQEAARVRERRHRLLHHGRSAAVQRGARQHLHGRQHQHGPRHGQGAWTGRRPTSASPTAATRWSPSSATAPSSTRASRLSWTWPTTTATRSPSSSTTAPRP